MLYSLLDILTVTVADRMACADLAKTRESIAAHCIDAEISAMRFGQTQQAPPLVVWIHPLPLFALTGCCAIIAVIINELLRITQNKFTSGKRRAPQLKNQATE